MDEDAHNATSSLDLLSKKKRKPSGQMLEMADLLMTTGQDMENPHQEKDLDDGAPVVEIKIEEPRPLHYSVSENPPVHLLVLFALQQALLNIGSPLTVAAIVAEVVCAQKDEEIKIQILSASMMMVGVATFLMSTVGVRLPIFQGPSSMYIVPLLAMSASTEWQCSPVLEVSGANSSANTTMFTSAADNSTFLPSRDMIFSKIAMLNGSLILVGLFHFLIGAFGLVGILLRYVGPVSIVPSVLLIGLYLFKLVVKFCNPSWLEASVTIAMIFVFSLYLGKKQTAIPWWSSTKGFHIFWFPFHQMFPVVLGITFGWALSAILTACGYFTDDSTSDEFLARSDAKGDLISKAPFLDIPYPGKLGGLSLSMAAFLSFFVASVMSVLDSIGDYSACARATRTPPIPSYAFNRGIAVEGFATILSGSMGCCHATTSFGPNIGAIQMTRVASRRVFQVCGLFHIFCAIVAKVGAVFICIPLPVLGGTFFVSIGIFIGVVISYLETIDLRSTRNLGILGTSLLLGLMVPYYVTEHPDKTFTGYDQIDMMIRVLMANPTFAGGIFACILDNTVPGTLKERGLLEQMKELEGDQSDLVTEKPEYMEGMEVYRLPYIPSAFRRSRLTKVFPMFDTVVNR